MSNQCEANCLPAARRVYLNHIRPFDKFALQAKGTPDIFRHYQRKSMLSAAKFQNRSMPDFDLKVFARGPDADLRPMASRKFVNLKDVKRGVTRS